MARDSRQHPSPGGHSQAPPWTHWAQRLGPHFPAPLDPSFLRGRPLSQPAGWSQAQEWGCPGSSAESRGLRQGRGQGGRGRARQGRGQGGRGRAQGAPGEASLWEPPSAERVPRQAEGLTQPSCFIQSPSSHARGWDHRPQ